MLCCYGTISSERVLVIFGIDQVNYQQECALHILY